MTLKKNIHWFIKSPFKMWEFIIRPKLAPYIGLPSFVFYKKEIKLSNAQKKYADSLRYFKPNIPDKESQGVLLVEMMREYEWTVRFAAASKVLAEKYNLQIRFYDPNWTSLLKWRHKRNRINRFLLKSNLEKIVGSFGGPCIFYTEDAYSNQDLIRDKMSQIKKGLVHPKDILEIKFENILVGDLLYDTYLRYYNQPTIEEINRDVLSIIEIGLNIFYNFKNLLKKYNVKVLLNLYTSYIEHGITTRICLHEKIDVQIIGSYTYVLQKLTEDFPYHHPNHTLYSADKIISPDKIQVAKEKFTSRFNGQIDAATSYMRKSAYMQTPINEDLRNKFGSKKRNVVIYAHEFYDSPHINRMLQFPDLYQFLKQTLDELTDLKDTNIFIKTHPNAVSDSKVKTIELVNSYKKNYFHILDESVSNLHIVELKPTLVATARGTIALEMAYFEIPTVALFDNLYTNFNFVHTCKNTESYFGILRGEQQPIIDFDKEKIYSFYYQCFLEKAITEENNVIDLLAAIKVDAYNDKYLEFIFNNGYLEKRKQLLEYSVKALENED